MGRFEIEFAQFTKVVVDAETEEEAKDLAAIMDGEEIAEHDTHEYNIWTVTILSVATLHDEFGFGTQRCDRFIKRFNKKAECIMDDMASWNDYIKTIKEELGIELGIRENK